MGSQGRRVQTDKLHPDQRELKFGLLDQLTPQILPVDLMQPHYAQRSAQHNGGLQQIIVGRSAGAKLHSELHYWRTPSGNLAATSSRHTGLIACLLRHLLLPHAWRCIYHMP